MKSVIFFLIEYNKFLFIFFWLSGQSQCPALCILERLCPSANTGWCRLFPGDADPRVLARVLVAAHRSGSSRHGHISSSYFSLFVFAAVV